MGMGWAVDCWFVGGLVFVGDRWVFFFFFLVLLVVSALVGCV